MASLADLLQAATPGPWGHDWRRLGANDDDARLIALTPELAAVAIAAEYWKDTLGSYGELNARDELIKALADLRQRLAE